MKHKFLTGILSLAVALSLLSVSACTTVGDHDPTIDTNDPIVTPGNPDDQTPTGDNENPGDDTPSDDNENPDNQPPSGDNENPGDDTPEPEPTEGMEYMLLTPENSEGFEMVLGYDFEPCYVLTGLGTATTTEIVIPSEYNGLPVRLVQIQNWNESITSLYIPDSVNVVTLDMYYGQPFGSNLTNIRLPHNQDAVIASNMFQSCDFYQNPANWEDGALYIDDWLLATNEELQEDYTVKSGTYGIAYRAFSILDEEEDFSSTKVKKVNVPNTVTALNGSFIACTLLEEVVLPNTVTKIGPMTFAGCSALESISIPNQITTIGYNAFWGCTNLAQISIPDSVTFIDDIAIEDTAYYNTPANWDNNALYIGNHLIKVRASSATAGQAETFNVKNGTKTVASFAFESCNAITNVAIADSVIAIGVCAFYDCENLTGLILPNSVTKIFDSTFEGCVNLTSIIIPENVTSIGSGAFFRCDNLTSITIPKNVSSIGNRAFSYCNSLQTVYYTGTQEDWEKIDIGSNNEELTEANIIFAN